MLVLLQPLHNFIPVCTVRVKRVLLASPSKQLIHIVIQKLHISFSCKSLSINFFNCILAFARFDFDEPTEIPNRSAISACENPSITYILNATLYDGGNLLTSLINSLYKIF